MNRCDVLSKKSFLIEKMFRVLISHFIMLSEIVSTVNLHCQAFSGLQLHKQLKEKKKKKLGTGLPTHFCEFCHNFTQKQFLIGSEV